MSRDIGDMVARVLEENPLPESLAELPAVTRRQIETAAEVVSMTPSAYYALQRAEARTEAADRAMAIAFVAEVRRGF